jgi:hypothetical protein
MGGVLTLRVTSEYIGGWERKMEDGEWLPPSAPHNSPFMFHATRACDVGGMLSTKRGHSRGGCRVPVGGVSISCMRHDDKKGERRYTYL